jgi:hypothetical protein
LTAKVDHDAFATVCILFYFCLQHVVNRRSGWLQRPAVRMRPHAVAVSASAHAIAPLLASKMDHTPEPRVAAAASRLAQRPRSASAHRVSPSASPSCFSLLDAQGLAITFTLQQRVAFQATGATRQASTQMHATLPNQQLAVRVQSDAFSHCVLIGEDTAARNEMREICSRASGGKQQPQ